MINILIVGYGKMGKMVAENIDHIGGCVRYIHDPNIPEYNNELDLSNIDVAIEFTHPKCGFENVRNLLSKSIPVVTGTTGWFDRLDELKKEFSPETHTLVYGANFSVGMNILYDIVEHAAKLIDTTKLYDVYGIEYHHNKKADSPSGTAKVISDIILKNVSTKDKAVYDLNNTPIKENELNFSSVRAGSIIGYHEIGFDSDFDEIKISHNVKNRKAFAVGALMAAKWASKNRGFYDFRSIIRELN